jgi:radical SAM enzyme (TIGR01210 family)
MLSDMTEKPLACWNGRDRIRDQVLDSVTIILKTGGCAWSRCRMCSYRHERYGGLSKPELTARMMQQLGWVRDNVDLSGKQLVKLYTSGSFFDPVEVPIEVRAAAGDLFRGKLVIVETRPEYVQKDGLEEFISRIDDGTWKTPIYVAIGIETASDQIREKSICKGFSYEQYECAAREAVRAGAGVKGYLLMKPLFLSEREAVDDMHRSIGALASSAELISMNPCTVQRRTELEFYWKRGAYRPPYLWSILSVIRDAPVHITVDPLGGGDPRGPHNCGRCDREIIRGIRDYSLSGDRALIQELLLIPCSCKREWEYVMDQEMPYCMPLTR